MGLGNKKGERGGGALEGSTPEGRAGQGRQASATRRGINWQQPDRQAGGRADRHAISPGCHLLFGLAQLVSQAVCRQGTQGAQGEVWPAAAGRDLADGGGQAAGSPLRSLTVEGFSQRSHTVTVHRLLGRHRPAHREAARPGSGGGGRSSDLCPRTGCQTGQWHALELASCRRGWYRESARDWKLGGGGLAGSAGCRPSCCAEAKEWAIAMQPQQGPAEVLPLLPCGRPGWRAAPRQRGQFLAISTEPRHSSNRRWC
jgi:hypothetical protein